MLRECRDKGDRVTLLFLWLPSAEIALARVARRVAQGGHRIPEDVVLRRYAAGLKNLRHLYLPIADIAYIYDNADDGGVLIAERQPGVPLLVRDGTESWRLPVADLTPQEIIDRITRGLELTRKQFAKPKTFAAKHQTARATIKKQPRKKASRKTR
jgi:hypothetical protein